MAHIFIQHDVADYEAWHPVFDADKPGREAAGAVGVAVLRGRPQPQLDLDGHRGRPVDRRTDDE